MQANFRAPPFILFVLAMFRSLIAHIRGRIIKRNCVHRTAIVAALDAIVAAHRQRKRHALHQKSRSFSLNVARLVTASGQTSASVATIGTHDLRPVITNRNDIIIVAVDRRISIW